MPDVPNAVAEPSQPALKPKLLVIELWGLGDLLIATPFLQAASRAYAVTLVAKPYALDLRQRFWPEVAVRPFVAPWTAFKNKYQFWRWPWFSMVGLLHRLAMERFEFGLSARRGTGGEGDPRDHLLLLMARARKRLGFPHLGSGFALTQRLSRPAPHLHRYENWRAMAHALGFEMPTRERLVMPQSRPDGEILIHTGAGQAVRVWPLERYRGLATRLRQANYRVQVACDPDQRDWWLQGGETHVATPRTVAELFALVDRAGAFIGNDSGPGHLAAFCGVPTFTLFGPQMAEWFAPLHPAAEWMEGKACPYKPCADYCRFATPCCIANTQEEEVWPAVHAFAARTFHGA